MFRNFFTIIFVVGIIIILASNFGNILMWSKDFFKSETPEISQEDLQKNIIEKDSSKSSLGELSKLEEINEQKPVEDPSSITSDSEINEVEKIIQDDLIEQKEEQENTASSDQVEQYEDIVQIEEEIKIEEKESIEQIIQGVVISGDTIIELLEPYDDANRVKKFLNAAEDIFSPKKFRIGQPYTIVYDKEANSIKSFEYEIDKFKKLIISGEEPKAKVEEIVYEKRLSLVKNNIKDNFFLSVTSIGEDAQLAMRIASIFAWEINFIRDIREDDSFAILVEKLYREDEFKGYGKALAATFTNKGKSYRAFLFYDAKKIEGYYSEKGQSLKKVLLQSPLSFTRVTSGYSRSRKHPIFGDYRPHLGIDYGAPTGTPVMAVGDGIVKLRGWVGGYGYQVVLKHSSGFESMYSHLSRFPKNLKKGNRVRQGQVIGYVGSTGNSTGPHLDFRLKRHGKFINPSSAMSPRAEPITKRDKASFDKWVTKINEFMNDEKKLESYTPDMFKPSL